MKMTKDISPAVRRGFLCLCLLKYRTAAYIIKQIKLEIIFSVLGDTGYGKRAETYL